MNRKIAIPRVEPRGLSQLSHRLQTKKSIALYPPAPLPAQQAGQNVENRIEVRQYVKSPPQQVIACIHHHRDLFRRDDLPQPIDKLRSARAAREYANHAALTSLARPSRSQAP